MTILTNDEYRLLLLAVQTNASEETCDKALRLLNAKVDLLRMNEKAEAAKAAKEKAPWRPAPYPIFDIIRFTFKRINHKDPTEPYTTYFNRQYVGHVKRDDIGEVKIWSAASPKGKWARAFTTRHDAAIHLAQVVLGDFTS